jgi:FRG domain
MPYNRIDCTSWSELLDQVMLATRTFEGKYSESGVPFFRGHCSSSFRLLPGFFRGTSGLPYALHDEQNFYYEFRARSGSLLSSSLSSWDVLFLMQHHGVPTRLLDWTESFATALYFALEGATSDIDVWMLDPYGLNQEQANTAGIVDVESNLKTEYFDLFIEPAAGARSTSGSVVAIYPRRQIARLASQHGLFTLHYSPTALEDLNRPWLTRFTLTAAAVDETKRLLKVLGVNDFSLFPDLDGLSRFLRKRIKGGYGIAP